MHAKHNIALARHHYSALAIASRVEGANPHGLVTILYEELMQSLEIVAVALAMDQPLTHNRYLNRARAIFTALIASLDYDQGGSLVELLDHVYRSMARQLEKIVIDRDAAKLDELQTGIKSLSDAWARIG